MILKERIFHFQVFVELRRFYSTEKKVICCNIRHLNQPRKVESKAKKLTLSIFSGASRQNFFEDIEKLPQKIISSEVLIKIPFHGCFPSWTSKMKCPPSVLTSLKNSQATFIGNQVD